MRISVSAYPEHHEAIIAALDDALSATATDESGFLVYYVDGEVDEAAIEGIARAAGANAVTFDGGAAKVDVAEASAEVEAEPVAAVTEANNATTDATTEATEAAPVEATPLDAFWEAALSSTTLSRYALGEQVQALRHGLAGVLKSRVAFDGGEWEGESFCARGRCVSADAATLVASCEELACDYVLTIDGTEIARRPVAVKAAASVPAAAAAKSHHKRG